MLCADPNLLLRYRRHIPLTFFFWIFAFLHKNNFKERKCILWRYKLVSYLIDIHSLKWCLQKFKIVNILMLQFCLKFYFLQTNAAWKEHVHELTIGRSWKETRKVRAWVCPQVRRRTARQEAAVITPSPHGHVCPAPHNLLAHRGWCGREGAEPQGSSFSHCPFLTFVLLICAQEHRQVPRTMNTTLHFNDMEIRVNQLFLGSIRKKKKECIFFCLPFSCYLLQVIKRKTKIAENLYMRKLLKFSWNV